MSILSQVSLSAVENIMADLFHSKNVITPLLLLLIEEAGIPIPIPGDIMIAYAGYQVSIAMLTFGQAFIFLLLTALLGSTILYFLSYRWGQTLVFKIGKYIHLDQKKLLAVEEQFRRYGPLVIIVGRHIPGLRIPITIFAGMSKVSPLTFIVSTAASMVVWILFYLSLGVHLGPKTASLIHDPLFRSISFVIPLLIIATFFFWRRNQTTESIER